MHAWACSVFGTSSPCFSSPPIAAFESQFPAKASIGVDDDAEAHEPALDPSLKKTCRCEVPAVDPSSHPSIDEENGASMSMKGPPSDTPNLDDILERDFAELKVGEANIQLEETTPSEVPSEAPVVKPIVYNQRIDAVEDREAFAVAAPAASATSQTDDEEKPEPAKQEVLKEPTSTLGDDFDVDW
jgi:hypothetical protein